MYNQLFNRLQNRPPKPGGQHRRNDGQHGRILQPTFKSTDALLRAGKSSIESIDGIEIASIDENVNPINFDFNTGIGSISYQKQSYKPLYAYKSFLKMSLCCVAANDVSNYKFAFDCLNSEQFNNFLKPVSRLAVYRINSIGWERPFAILFKKIDRLREIPSHLFVLFAQNSINQILIPFHRDDRNVYKTEFQTPRCPPMFPDQDTANAAIIHDAIFDLNSDELVKKEQETINFKVDPEDLKRLVKYNPTTKEFDTSPELPSIIIKLILVENGTKIDLSKL